MQIISVLLRTRSRTARSTGPKSSCKGLVAGFLGLINKCFPLRGDARHIRGEFVGLHAHCGGADYPPAGPSIPSTSMGSAFLPATIWPASSPSACARLHLQCYAIRQCGCGTARYHGATRQGDIRGYLRALVTHWRARDLHKQCVAALHAIFNWGLAVGARHQSACLARPEIRPDRGRY